VERIMSEDGLTLDTARAALEAVYEALNIPHPATVGDAEKRAEILATRVMHATVLLRGITEGTTIDLARSVEYLRERLAECPAEGYRTWDEAVAETRERERKAAGDGGGSAA
jgi:hypothetical protein